MASIELGDFGAALAALSALSTAAFGLLDSSKAFWGGVSNVGLPHIRKALDPFAATLGAGVGAERWWALVRANWLNGVAKAEQKAVVRSILKLGLTQATADELAQGCNVDAARLKTVAGKLAKGDELSDADLNLLGRVNAVLDAILDCAFERAEQQYRNVSRLLAGLLAVALAVVAQLIWAANAATMGAPPSLAVAVGVGLLAVPVAPVAKDVTSALSTAMRALKATRAV